LAQTKLMNLVEERIRFGPDEVREPLTVGRPIADEESSE
jgi:hypothetical protein